MYYCLCEVITKDLSFDHKLILTCTLTACSESYNVSQSLVSSCHLGCDNQKSLDSKSKSKRSDRRPLSLFWLFPVSSSYQISWTKSIEKLGLSGNSSLEKPLLMLKHSWSRFFANRSFTILEKLQGSREPMTEKVDVTTMSSNKQPRNGPPTGKLTTPKIKEENKSTDCYVRGGNWPPLYIQELSPELKGIQFCTEPSTLTKFTAILTVVLMIILITTFFYQVNTVL